MFFNAENLRLFFKGIIIGIGTLIPGVSGGTTAIITGVFEDILEAVSGIFTHFKSSVIYLMPLCAGGLLGITAISPVLRYFEVNFPIIAKYVFCILALISAVIFAKNRVLKDFNTKSAISVISGAIIAYTVSILLTYYEINIENDSFVNIFLISLPLSLALVLPAISFSYMLYFFNMHEKTLAAISEINISFLLPMAIGILLGCILFSKLLLKLIDRCQQYTYSFVCGFVIFSIVTVFMQR